MQNTNKKELKKHLQIELELPSSKADIVCDLYKEEKIPKGKFLIKQGGYAKKIVFLHQGYIRCYTDNLEKEITHWVYWKNRWVTDFPSFKKYRSSPWNFQAITDCVVHSITETNYNKLLKLIPNWDFYENKLLFKLFIALESRLFTFISMNATERYQYLHNEHPEIFNQIPSIYISSLLNMTPETFSRIRRKSIS